MNAAFSYPTSVLSSLFNPKKIEQDKHVLRQLAADLDFVQNRLGTEAVNNILGGGDAQGDVFTDFVDNIFGSQGDDFLMGNGTTPGAPLANPVNGNLINGNGGNDEMYGQGGTDTLNGGDGNDTLIGGSGNDIITGNGNTRANCCSPAWWN